MTVDKVGQYRAPAPKVVATLPGGNQGNQGNQGNDNNGGDDDLTLVVYNDFENGKPGSWETGKGEGYNITVADGKYRMALEKDASIYSTSTDKKANFADGVVSASVELDGEGLAGLVGRLSENGDNVEMYMCFIDSDSEFACLKRIKGEWKVLTSAKKSDAIKPNGPNIISLAVIGNKYAFYANDKELAAGADNDIKDGSWGVYAETTPGDFAALYDAIAIYKSKP